MCPSEKHVEEREGFDELEFVMVGKINDELGDGVCSDESLVARMATSWASSRRVAMDMVCLLTEEKSV